VSTLLLQLPAVITLLMRLGIRLINNVVYWLWVVRDLNTGKVVAVRLSETRSGLDVILLSERGQAGEDG